ncbi:MAG: UDP-glucose/GDP-mannose dehydrogenase family protein, partial [Actinobacteria bacterium]|nr:UDP-glucose/GDP-mannose dehydrogenase family protein [Actinomycetota bacterium]
MSEQRTRAPGMDYGSDRHVLVVGLWHLGTVAAACWTRLGWTVTAYDPAPERIAGLARGRPPVAEPGLAELISAGVSSGRLRFTNELGSAAAASRLAVVAFDTPVDDEDRPDLTPVEEAVGALGRSMPGGSVIVLMSQVPVGTSRALQGHLDAEREPGSVSIVCSPENLRLGQAIDRFLSPGFVILGAADAPALGMAGRLFEGVAGQLLPMDATSAELCKHYINAYLAT